MILGWHDKAIQVCSTRSFNLCAWQHFIKNLITHSSLLFLVHNVCYTSLLCLLKIIIVGTYTAFYSGLVLITTTHQLLAFTKADIT